MKVLNPSPWGSLPLAKGVFAPAHNYAWLRSFLTLASLTLSSFAVAHQPPIHRLDAPLTNRPEAQLLWTTAPLTTTYRTPYNRTSNL